MNADFTVSAYSSLGFAQSALREALAEAKSLLEDGRVEQIQEMLDDLTDLKSRLGSFPELVAVKSLLVKLSSK